MSYNKFSRGQSNALSLLEIILIAILVVILIAIAYSLFGPYIETLIEERMQALCEEQNLLCR